MAPPNEGSTNHCWPPLLPEANWRRMVKRLGLSNRQAEVAALLCRDCGIEEIAAALRISPDAVRHHSKALFRKLGVTSRVGVVLRFVHAQQEDGSAPYMRM